MTIPIGAFVQPNYNATPFTPGPGNVLSDPAMTGIALEIVGGGSSSQQSWTWWPNILHAFYNTKGYCPNAGSAGVPMPLAGVRYIPFDDTPAQSLGSSGNKYANSGTLILCFTLPHSFYVGQFVQCSGITATINTGGISGGGVYQVTAINSAVNGTSITTAYNVSLKQGTSTNITTSAQTTGTVAAAAAYSTATSGGYSALTPFTNITDTTGLNTNNLGPRRWIDYVAALYTQYSATPPTFLVTLRTGGVSSSHNMENASSWQQNAGTDEWDPAYIIAGNHDAYFNAFFSQVADYMYANQSYNFVLRIDQEMNGASYSWCYNNQWIEPVNSIAPTATPSNGPSLLNVLNQSATSGNPITSYGLYAKMFQHIVSLAKTQFANQLQNAHGMTSGQATTLAANYKFHECFGSGSIITPTANAPIVTPPYPQIPHTLALPTTGGYTITGVASAGGNTTLTVNPGTDFTSGTSGTWNLVGHGIWPGALICPGGTAIGTGSADTVASITNTTITFPTGTFTYQVGGSVTLWWGSSAAQTYIQSVGGQALFFAGDSTVDIPGFDGYNSGKTGGTWKNFTSQTQGSGSYPGASIFSAAYTAVTAITAKTLMITETGCPEGNSTAITGVNAPNTASKPQWIITNLGSGGQLLSGMTQVGYLVYFDQTGRGSSYSVRTSPQALTQWQALGSVYTTNGVLPINPPISTGLQPRTLIIRNNTAANFAQETSKTIAELAMITDTPALLGGAASALLAPENMPWLPFAPAGALTLGQVFTATGAHAASFQAPTVINGVTVSGTPTAGYVLTATSATAATWQAASSAVGGTNFTTVLGSNLTSIVGGQTNVLVTSGSNLTSGYTYLLIGNAVMDEASATNVFDLYFQVGTATTSSTFVASTSGKASAVAGTQNANVAQILVCTGTGTVTLNAYPAGASTWTCYNGAQGGSTLKGTWMQAIRIA